MRVFRLWRIVAFGFGGLFFAVPGAAAVIVDSKPETRSYFRDYQAGRPIDVFDPGRACDRMVGGSFFVGAGDRPLWRAQCDERETRTAQACESGSGQDGGTLLLAGHDEHSDRRAIEAVCEQACTGPDCLPYISEAEDSEARRQATELDETAWPLMLVGFVMIGLAMKRRARGSRSFV